MPSLLATALFAESSGGGAGSLVNILILLLIPFGMYFLLIRPQRRRAREQRELQQAIQIGDEVVTTSGMYGKITGEDGATRFWLEVDDDVQIRIARAAIQGRVTEPDADESPVADDVVDVADSDD